MKTKTALRLTATGTAMLIVLSLSGCDLLTGLLGMNSILTASQRVDRFISDISTGNYAKVNDNFDQAVLTNNPGMDQTYWENSPFSSQNAPFTLSNESSTSVTSVPNAPEVTSAIRIDAQISGNYSGATSTPITFYLIKESDGNYLIRELDYNTGSTSTIQLYNVH